jgi:hypothetical protein
MTILLRLCIRVVLVCVIAVAGWLSWGFYRNHKIERAFEELPLGTSRAEVGRRLGKPLDSQACIASFADESACSHLMIYPYAFAPYLPAYWVFGFDDKGRLTDLSYTTSP